jgi:NAD(P)-dependent dehydrogenase (short-subunit alcohol dehydrogenase family)
VEAKVAIVTGGASGIGRAAGARLAEAGFRTVMADVDPSGRKVAAAIEPAVFVEHDVTDEPAWERAVRTPIWAKAGIGPEEEAALAAASPLGRMAEPEEVADATVHLACDASRFVTGSELVIDGGCTAA